jgi:hypothetical protein
MNADAQLKTEANIAALRAAELGLTQAMIAVAIGASQSQVSRILSGGGVRRSRLFDDVCKYVCSISDNQAWPGESDELQAALAEVWDGTPRHAKALALVIRSLGALSPRVPPAPASRGKVGSGAA